MLDIVDTMTLSNGKAFHNRNFFTGTLQHFLSPSFSRQKTYLVGKMV